MIKQQVQIAHPDHTIEVWFQDEARVGQHGRLTRTWGRKGERQRLKKDFGFESTHIYGAVCPERDLGEALVINQVSKEVMEFHLEAVSARIPQDRHAIMVMDRAPWHRSLRVPGNITVVHLPPYSPELNPHENIWEFLKNTYLSNKVYRDLDHVIDACCSAWNQMTAETGRITSIATREWI